MIILLASLLLSFPQAFACDFPEDVKRVYSLSGPVTLMLKDLGLLKNKKLKAVSIFHPISKKEFSGEFLPGGVFLSHDTIKALSGSLLFYDESRELTKILSAYKSIKAVEIKSRSLTPSQVMQSLTQQMKNHLPGCELEVLNQKLSRQLLELKKKLSKKKSVLFFLGHFKSGRLPETLMVNDGIVKWMIEEKLISTYPSELSYVNWSSKIMNDFPKNSYMVGIKDSGNSLDKKIEKNQTQINLTYPGALIPGRGQVEAMLYLFENL